MAFREAPSEGIPSIGMGWVSAGSGRVVVGHAVIVYQGPDSVWFDCTCGGRDALIPPGAAQAEEIFVLAEEHLAEELLEQEGQEVVIVRYEPIVPGSVE